VDWELIGFGNTSTHEHICLASPKLELRCALIIAALTSHVLFGNT